MEIMTTDFKRRTRKDKFKFKLSEENAQEQLGVFLDYYEIFPDEFGTKEELSLYNMHCANLITAIRAGRIAIAEPQPGELEVLQTTSSGAEIKYSVLGLEAKSQVSGIKYSIDEKSGVEMAAEMTRRNIAILGHLSKEGADIIIQLKGVDMSAAESLAFLFGLV